MPRETTNPPVITIDGPSGVGKSTLSADLADVLGYHLLNSGMLYRALAHLLLEHHADAQTDALIEKLARSLHLVFKGRTADGVSQVFLHGVDVTHALSDPLCSTLASQLAVKPFVREALLDKQRMFQTLPGLIAEGRDMGNIVFKNAHIKFFLTASVEERAKRRSIQLQQTEFHANVRSIAQQLEVRDERDRQRRIAPLKIGDDMLIIDTTHMTRDNVLKNMLKKVKEANIV